VFEKYFARERPARRFEDLTLYQYVELLLHKKRWLRYQSVFVRSASALSRDFVVSE
jgi:hypothetical protein